MVAIRLYSDLKCFSSLLFPGKQMFVPTNYLILWYFSFFILTGVPKDVFRALAPQRWGGFFNEKKQIEDRLFQKVPRYWLRKIKLLIIHRVVMNDTREKQGRLNQSQSTPIPRPELWGGLSTWSERGGKGRRWTNDFTVWYEGGEIKK